LVAILLGCGLRLAQYLLDRSLWMDEAYLSLNLVHRSFAGLWRPLDYHQGAPIGFLLLEKSAIRMAGSSEYALRLLPLLAGIGSVLLFYKLASKVLPPRAVAIAVGLFAVSPSLIYYSSEVKQYSLDVAIAVLLYCLTIEGSNAKWTTGRFALTALVGACAVWLSHSSIFVLAGIGSTIVITLIWRRDWVRLWRMLLVGLFWLGSLAVCYFLALRKLAGDKELLNYWNENFMPFPPHSVADFKWFVDSFFAFFNTSAGLAFTGLVALVFVLGVLSMFQKSPECVSLLLSPALLTLLASGLHKYPFGGRLTLFLVPASLLLMAEGTDAFLGASKRSLPAAGSVLLALLFLDPGMYILHHFAKPRVEVTQPGVMFAEEIRPVMSYVRDHENSNDLVYVFYGAIPAFDYYAEREHFPLNNVELGTASGDNPDSYGSDVDRLRGHRVWVVLSHTHGVGAQESRYLLFYLDQVGTRRNCVDRAGAETCLYDLSTPATATTAHTGH
jgi:hypothetical protein